EVHEVSPGRGGELLLGLVARAPVPGTPGYSRRTLDNPRHRYTARRTRATRIALCKRIPTGSCTAVERTRPVGARAPSAARHRLGCQLAGLWRTRGEWSTVARHKHSLEERAYR